MTWREAALAAAPAFGGSTRDSRRFGRTVDRISVSLACEATITDVRRLVDKSTADVVIVRYPAERVDWFAEMTEFADRTAIFADTLMYWRLRTGEGRPAVSDDVSLVGPGDDLDDLVAEGFAGSGNHYRANPLFDDQLALQGYQEWARHSADAGQVFVVRGEQTPLGMLSWQRTDDHFDVLLCTVRPSARGQGIFSRLVAALERHAVESGVGQIYWPTQAYGMTVQRSLVRYGFEPVHNVATVHLVRTKV